MGFIALGLFILACGWKVYRDYIPTRAKAIVVKGILSILVRPLLLVLFLYLPRHCTTLLLVVGATLRF